VEGAGAGEELDLAQTARMALDGSGPVPVVRAAPEEERPEPAFFVPEAPPAGEDAIDITMPDSPAPRFEQPETPPLGMPMTSPPGSPGIREEPEHVGVLPEPEPASEPVGFSFSMPEERPMADLGLEPPKTEVLDRRPPPPVAVPPPSPPPAPPEPVAVPGPPPEASVPPPFAFEEEAPREAVAPSRPSKEDLAALDALLNPSASMRSTSVPAPRPRAERWDPQFRPAPISRPSRRQRSFPVVPVALAAALVVGSGAAAWYFYGRPPQAAPSPKPLARPTPRSVVPTATAAAASPAPVQTTPSPEAASATAPPPTAAPATPPPTAPPVVAVTPTPAPAPAAGGMAEASQLLERRDYPGAARAFVASIRTTPQARYSVQLLVACADETVDKALANASAPELFILPVSYKGRSCYRLCWGLYDSEARADTALSSVPAYFREGGAKPKVAATSVLLP
jgi:septal ring-binding cell division protein DamX